MKQTPGPGQYKPERAQNHLDAKRDANIKRSSSMFLSSTKRNPYENLKAKEKGPPLGAYEVTQHTIQDSIKDVVESSERIAETISEVSTNTSTIAAAVEEQSVAMNDLSTSADGLTALAT